MLWHVQAVVKTANDATFHTDETYKHEIEEALFWIDEGEVPIHISISKA